MRSPLARLAERWRSLPVPVIAAVLLLLFAGVGVILQNEAAYREQKVHEAEVQAEILAASVTAALDFGDSGAAQESVDALRVNPQVRTVGVYNADRRLVAGFERGGEILPPVQSGPLEAPGNAVSAFVPVISGGKRIGVVYLSADPEPFSSRLARYLLIGLLVVMAVLVVAVLGIAHTALRRANRELEARADALVGANAELKVQIGERTKAEDQLRQAQKMQALGQLTGGIAHDFNNLLTVIQGSADMLSRPQLTEEKRIRFAEAVVQAASRAAALTGQLLAFARRQPLQPEVMNVNELILGMSELLDRTLGERIAVQTHLADGACQVEADRAQLESALLNIAVNARDAMPGGGTLTISTAAVQGEAGEMMIAISVADDGIGMNEETLGRVFEPFFTTKSPGQGTGLGLSQVYGFATQSGGEVRVESAPGEGTTIELLLPCSAAEMAAAAEEEPEGTARHRRGSILLVEDNDEVGAFAEDLLTELGHRVTRACSGGEALDWAERRDYDLVFTDVVMPGMSGLELAERLNRLRPDLPVVLTTGYSDEIARSGTGGRPVILKPYRLESLAAVLNEVLGPEK